MNASLSIFRAFHTILRTTTATLLYTYTVESATYNMIAHTRKVLNSTSAYEYNTVLLEIVALIWDVSDHFDAIGQSDFSHFANRRIRLLRSSSHYLDTNPTTKGVPV